MFFAELYVGHVGPESTLNSVEAIVSRLEAIALRKSLPFLPARTGATAKLQLPSLQLP